MSEFDGTVSPTRIGSVIIGQYWHINGGEPSGLVVTRHELEEVARYWCGEHLASCFFEFHFEQSEWRFKAYSKERLCAIELVIGKDRLEAIWEEVESSYRKEHKIGNEAWRIFKSGTPGERAAWLAVHGPYANPSTPEL